MGRERLSAPSKRSPFLLDRSQLRDRRRRMPSLTDTAIRHALKRVEAGQKQENLADGEGRGTGRLVLVLRPMPKRVRSEEQTSELQSLMRISYAVFCLQKTH